MSKNMDHMKWEKSAALAFYPTRFWVLDKEISPLEEIELSKYSVIFYFCSHPEIIIYHSKNFREILKYNQRVHRSTSSDPELLIVPPVPNAC